MADGSADDALKISKQYLSILVENNVCYTRAYLFGSYLKGKQNEFSDIDIAIFSRNWFPSRFEALQNLMKLRVKVDLRVEPHPFEEADKEDPFVREIIEKGKEIIIG